MKNDFLDFKHTNINLNNFKMRDKVLNKLIKMRDNLILFLNLFS